MKAHQHGSACVHGYSIVEIMIALTLGLLFSGMLIQLFMNARMAHQLENNLSVLGENARFVSHHMHQIIAQAGYRTLPDADQDVLFPKHEVVFDGAPYLSVSNNAGFFDNDILVVRYQGEHTAPNQHPIHDCAGNPVPAFEIVENIFSITADQALQCQSTHLLTGFTQTVVLAQPVEHMHVLVGEDTTQDNAPDRYLKGDHPFLVPDHIVSVRVALLLRSEDEVRSNTSTQTHNLNGTSVSTGPDRYLRHNLNVTVVLPNLNYQAQ